MEDQKHVPIEEMEFFRRYVSVADWAWITVSKWGRFERETIGGQLVRACDSVGANLVEGDGRFGDADGLKFFVIARASAREARYWICALRRGLIEKHAADAQLDDINEATCSLNSLIRYRRTRKQSDRVREPAPPPYLAGNGAMGDPFVDDLAT